MMELISNWKNLLILILFQTNSINQSSFVINNDYKLPQIVLKQNNFYYFEHSNTFSDNNLLVNTNNLMFKSTYYQHDHKLYNCNQTTNYNKGYKYTALDFNNTVNKTNQCNFSQNAILNHQLSLSLLPCYLNIIPAYNVHNVKHLLAQKSNKTRKKNLFFNYMDTRLNEITSLIREYNLRLNELRLWRYKFQNNNNRLARMINRNKVNLTELKAMMMKRALNTNNESNKYDPNEIYYETVYFDKTKNTIIRKYMYEENFDGLLLENSCDSYLNDCYRFNTDESYLDGLYDELFKINFPSLVKEYKEKIDLNNDNLKLNASSNITNNTVSAQNENQQNLNDNKNENETSSSIGRGGGVETTSLVNERFLFNYETENSVNLNVTIGSIFENSLLNTYAIIYDKNTQDLYLNILTNKLKHLRYKKSTQKRDIWHLNHESLPFKTKLKSVQFDVIKYDLFANFNLQCENLTRNNSVVSYLDEYDCEIKQENLLIKKLNNTGMSYNLKLI